jgi:hypothetical protein
VEVDGLMDHPLLAFFFSHRGNNRPGQDSIY